MCGIAGIVTYSEKPLEISIQRMQKALLHRGPDDRGIYISSDRKAALTHTRLSILDLSPAGHQPMCIADGRYWITFNGEIYNYRELRAQLESQGEHFQSQTDTEVILKLYQKTGPNCVNKMRGMFAFAIWDDQEKACFIARDPLGIKPLYYWQANSTLAFASELRAILASGLPSISLSAEGLYSYLASGSVPEPHTLIEGIHCLEAGHWLYWKVGHLTKQQYWQINFAPEAISPHEAAQKVRLALIDSIKYHFVSDVPVGIFFSGGIDSSSIVALARQTQQNQLRTYSIAFEEEHCDEGKIARETARYWGAEHVELTVNNSGAKALFTHFLEALDQPSIDGFNTYCVAQLAKNNGTKVVLSGLGGDELFGGYPSFREVPQMVRWGKRLQALKPISVGIGMGLDRWATSIPLKRLGCFLQQAPTTKTAYRSFRGVFTHSEIRAIARQYFPYLPEKFSLQPFMGGQIIAASAKQIPDNLPSVEDEVSFLEISQYMRNQLLRDSDVMSMAWGLELRVPFVDSVFLETLASIPSNLRLAPGKQLLIKAVPELPSKVVNRPKQGFVFPFQHWIEREWRDYFPTVYPPKNISIKTWYRRWSLAILKYWWERVSA
jgi:asparagine synthase (glutamine-hydrolysing)